MKKVFWTVLFFALLVFVSIGQAKMSGNLFEHDSSCNALSDNIQACLDAGGVAEYSYTENEQKFTCKKVFEMGTVTSDGKLTTESLYVISAESAREADRELKVQEVEQLTRELEEILK